MSKNPVHLCSLKVALHACRVGTGDVLEVMLATTFRPRLPGEQLPPAPHAQAGSETQLPLTWAVPDFMAEKHMST